MIAKRTRPEGLEDYEELRVRSYKAGVIVDIVNLSAGLDLAIENIKAGEITKKARGALQDLMAQSYGLFSYRRAFEILQEEGIAKENEQVLDYRYRFDLPDDTHDDLVIYYKKIS